MPSMTMPKESANWRNAAEKRGEQRFARQRRGEEKALVELEARLAQKGGAPLLVSHSNFASDRVGPEISPPDRECDCHHSRFALPALKEHM